MSNNRPYADPRHSLPRADTLLAAIVRSTPADGFADVAALCRSIGHEPRSLRALISTAVTRSYIEPVHPPHTSPQAYRLTPVGRLVKNALEL
jgi:hypothetical protein